ncbi:MAG: VOC family protein [Chloroflexota bacterium]
MTGDTTHPEVSFLKNGIRQIAVIVEDLDKAVEMYWSMLGIGPWHIYTYQKPLLTTMTYRGKPADYKMRLALADVGPLQIELIEVLDDNTVYAEFVKEHGYGLHHFGVLVDDMDAAKAEAEAAGLTITQDGGGHGLDDDGGFAYLDTEAKLSTTIELISRPKRRVQPESIYPPKENT